MAWEPSPKAPVTLDNASVEEMSKNEKIKLESKGLFHVLDPKQPHTFADELSAMEAGEAETIGNVAKELSKFFGIYKQQIRGERGRKTGDLVFMIRIKNPGGGVLSPEQWCALDDTSERFADGTLRITSRQAIQYHHVQGSDLRALVKHLNETYLKGGTLAACGDVNRNVMCSPIDGLDPTADPGGSALARDIAEALAPRTGAYLQIFLSTEDGAKNLTPEEPLYGPHYLPRKFKVGIAHPGDNSADVLTNDVGLVPATPDGAAWDFYSGGGMGLTHNNPHTAALLGEYLGRVRRDQVVDAVRGIVTLQRDHGDRKDRRLARWKYTIRRLGLERVRKELRDTFGIDLADSVPVPGPPMNLHLGWHEQRGGGGYYGISVESGRIKPDLRRAVRRAVTELGCGVRLTGQQDLILCGVSDRAALEALLCEEGVSDPSQVSMLRRNAMACPAKPTCGLAMTDAENVLPGYIDAVEAAGCGDVDAVIRMTGCPNNCARPPSAEVGIYGYGKNDHVILVGGSREGTRLAHPLYARLPEEQMVAALVGLFRAVKEHNAAGLPVGDFLHQTDPAQLRAWVGLEDSG
jgi:sulfite reductase (ferredoxin)